MDSTRAQFAPPPHTHTHFFFFGAFEATFWNILSFWSHLLSWLYSMQMCWKFAAGSGCVKERTILCLGLLPSIFLSSFLENTGTKA